VSDRWTVPLPPGAEPPLRVFVSGVPQDEGKDYRIRGRALEFDKPLAKEGRLGFWRWASMFLGLVGTYRKNDVVDVHWVANGKQQVATGLDIVPPDGHSGPNKP
jgi:hypothetical protein